MSWLSRILGTDASSDTAPTGDPDRVREVEAVLAELRPMLALDGGDFTLVAVTVDGWVHLRARGACAGCSAQASTLSQAIEARLRERCVWIRVVRSE